MAFDRRSGFSLRPSSMVGAIRVAGPIAFAKVPSDWESLIRHASSQNVRLQRPALRMSAPDRFARRSAAQGRIARIASKRPVLCAGGR